MHRLAWLYMTGEWPTDEIDHRDRDPSNNRWSNLREATHKQNLSNQGIHSNNRLGIRGVEKHGKRFRAYLGVEGKKVILGWFDTAEEAGAARDAAGRDMRGEFYPRIESAATNL